MFRFYINICDDACDVEFVFVQRRQYYKINFQILLINEMEISEAAIRPVFMSAAERREADIMKNLSVCHRSPDWCDAVLQILLP